MLKGDDRDGKQIGIEIVRIISNHASQIGRRVRRERVGTGNHSHGFKIVRGLQLLIRFLNLLVWNLVACKFVSDARAQAVVRGEISLIAG